MLQRGQHGSHEQVQSYPILSYPRYHMVLTSLTPRMQCKLDGDVLGIMPAACKVADRCLWAATLSQAGHVWLTNIPRVTLDSCSYLVYGD